MEKEEVKQEAQAIEEANIVEMNQEEQPEEQKQDLTKVIKITMLENGGVDVTCERVTNSDFFGMLHEAKRLITRQIEINEQMAFQEQMRKQQELMAVQQALAGKKIKR